MGDMPVLALHLCICDGYNMQKYTDFDIELLYKMLQYHFTVSKCKMSPKKIFFNVVTNWGFSNRKWPFVVLYVCGEC